MVQGLRLHASSAGGVGLIPGRGSKIPQACSLAKNKKREVGLRFQKGCSGVDKMININVIMSM